MSRTRVLEKGYVTYWVPHENVRVVEEDGKAVVRIEIPPFAGQGQLAEPRVEIYTKQPDAYRRVFMNR